MSTPGMHPLCRRLGSSHLCRESSVVIIIPVCVCVCVCVCLCRCRNVARGPELHPSVWRDARDAPQGRLHRGISLVSFAGIHLAHYPLSVIRRPRDLLARPLSNPSPFRIERPTVRTLRLGHARLGRDRLQLAGARRSDARRQHGLLWGSFRILVGGGYEVVAVVVVTRWR